MDGFGPEEGTARRTRARLVVAALAVAVLVVLPAAAQAAPPQITSISDIAGQSVTVGDTVSVTVVADAPVTYTWSACNGVVCNPVGTNAPSYIAQQADVGLTLRVGVVASNGEAPDATASSGPTQAVKAKVVPQVPPGVSTPTISGTATVGAQLTASATATAGDPPPPPPTFAWLSCNAGGNNCQPNGATGPTYTVGAGDAGTRLAVRATVDNGVPPPATADSAPTALVTSPPQLTSGPSIGGTAAVGQVLTASATASGVPAPALSYTWTSCDSAGANCVAAGTGAQYTVTAGDFGRRVRVTVVADNGVAPAASGSVLTGVVPGVAPGLGGPPGVTGAAIVGQTLQAVAPASPTGVPAPTITYQWERCSTPAACSAIPGATNPSYAITAADVGLQLRVVATASNGTLPNASAASALTAAVGTTPTASAAVSPASGIAAGQLVQANVTVAGTPLPTFTVQWERCSATTTVCNPITGATTTTYTTTATDVGSRLRVVATATSPNGSVIATSATTAVIAPAPAPGTPLAAPKLGGAPSVSGLAVVGQTLVADAVATGNPNPALTFSWLRCDATGASCDAIAGAAGQRYVITDADRGSTLRVAVTAFNGTAPDDTGRSAATGVVQAATVSGAAPNGSAFDTSSSGGPTSPAKGKAALSPFPQVRLRGRLVRGGAQVTLFTVVAPVRSRIDVRCQGRGCPRRAYVVLARHRSTRIRRFERYLRAGIKITIRISRSGYIGKYSSFFIHASKAPDRHDLCLPSAAAKPLKCTS